jgi:hypothetical protein
MTPRSWQSVPSIMEPGSSKALRTASSRKPWRQFNGDPADAMTTVLDERAGNPIRQTRCPAIYEKARLTNG